MNRLLKLSLAGMLSSSALFAQIELNENLSVTGFFDMSVVSIDSDIDGDDTAYNFDQAELDFIFDFDQVTGQLDINYLGDNDGNDVDFEQAFIAYDLGDGSSVRAGKFLSYMGWETAEPTGLYQYSYAYDIAATIPGYQNGVAYDYSSDAVAFGLAILDSVYAPDGSIGDSQYGFEAMAKFFPAEGVTVFLGYANDQMDEGDDHTLINFWASYEVGNATYAIEWNDYDFGAEEGSQWLAMASYAVSDAGTFTARIAQDTQDQLGGDEGTKYTAAYLHSVTDNLALVFEFSQTDFGAEGKTNATALEALFTF